MNVIGAAPSTRPSSSAITIEPAGDTSSWTSSACVRRGRDTSRGQDRYANNTPPNNASAASPAITTSLTSGEGNAARSSGSRLLDRFGAFAFAFSFAFAFAAGAGTGRGSGKPCGFGIEGIRGDGVVSSRSNAGDISLHGRTISGCG